jgi:hypothetical protein
MLTAESVRRGTGLPCPQAGGCRPRRLRLPAPRLGLACRTPSVAGEASGFEKPATMTCPQKVHRDSTGTVTHLC